MKFLILLTLFAFVAVETDAAQTINLGYQCNYQNGQIIETGYPSRPMTAAEKQQIVEYEKKWEPWRVQLDLFIRGKAPMPTVPVMPCFCRKACKF